MPDNLILRYYIDFLQEGITVGRTADGVQDDELPYSRKFSRGPIFAVFTVDWQTTKIKPAK